MVIQEARRTGYTRTLMGRYRKLPDITSRKGGAKGHSERAAINTPIQGGAADVVMMAMIKLNQSPVLERLGYELLLQIHDEVGHWWHTWTCAPPHAILDPSHKCRSEILSDTYHHQLTTTPGLCFVCAAPTGDLGGPGRARGGSTR